ncbi:MAG: APC family permease [Candidatus Diapherotrites archaeon]|nr:APC family permease [Candidatus Diapherotrites archaeon]
MPLKKQLGFWPVVLSGIGIIIGAGIYALVGKAAGISGYWIWAGFLVSAFVAVLTGLSYAELSSMIPKAGAEFHYTKKAYGRRVGFITGWILILAGVISCATVALGFGNYFFSLFGISPVLAAIGLLASCIFLISKGIKESVTIGVIFTVFEALGLIFIILISLPFVFSGGNFARIFDFSTFDLFSIIKTAALVFFAFIGFEEIVRLAEETKNAEKNIPKALFAAIAFSTVIYILVSISAVSVLTPQELAASNAPLGDVAGKILGPNAFLILSGIALIATASTVLLILIATSRIVYGIAEDKELPHIIAKVDRKTHTPIIAVALSGILAMAFLFVGGIELIANSTDLMLFIAFAIVNLTVIRLRFSEPKMHRPFKIPFNIGRVPIPAVLGFLTSSLLMFGINKDAFIVGLGLVALGIAFEEFHYRKFIKF